MGLKYDRLSRQLRVARAGSVFVTPWYQVGLFACGYAALSVVATSGARSDVFSIAVGATLAAYLIYLSMIDIAQFRLPDALTLPLLAVGLALAAWGGVQLLAWHLISAGLGFGAFRGIGFLYERYRGVQGLGLGDAKFLAAAGAWFGAEPLATLVLIAAVTALSFVAISAANGRVMSRSMRLPFGPFLAVGFWCVWLLA